MSSSYTTGSVSFGPTNGDVNSFTDSVRSYTFALCLNRAKLAAVEAYPTDPHLGERVFYLTDQRAYLWDGSAWNRLG